MQLITTCADDPGYPEQIYNSALPDCPLPAQWPTELGVPNSTTPGAGEPGYGLPVENTQQDPDADDPAPDVVT